MTTCIKRWLMAAAAVAVGFAAQAATIDKTNNVDNLNLTTSWRGGVTPKVNDIARWGTFVAGPNTVLLGAGLSYQGIQIVNPGGDVAIGGDNTLTNGFQGLNLSTAQRDLTLTNANLRLLDYASQVWNVTNSRTLTISPASLTRGDRATLGVQGTGTAASTTITNDATGFIGTWARYGTGTAMKYATMVGGVITGYTGTAAATAADVTDTTGALNYDVAAVGTLAAGASFNTLRYTGAAGTIAGDFTAHGLLNASSSGTLTLSGNATIGESKELVLTSPDATRQLTLSGAIGDNGGGASGITLTGGGRANLSGNNTYSGPTVISSGLLVVNHSNALGTTAGNTIIYSTGSAANGGQLAFSGGVTAAEPITLFGPGDGASGGYTRGIDALSGTNTLSGTVTLTGTAGYRIGIGPSGTVLNLGLIQRSTAGGGLLLCDPQAGTVINVNTAIDNNGGDMTCHAGGGSGITVLNVSNNDLGNVYVQNDSLLKITAVNALATNRNLQVGRELGNAEKGANNDKGIFYLDAASQTVSALNGYSNNWSTASSTIFRRVSSTTSGAKTFTVGNANGTGSFDGVIEDGTGGGTIALTKVGTGTQTLTGTRDNTYTGLTTVNNGTLNLSKVPGTNSISGNVVVGAGTLQNGLDNQIADTATVTMTNATAKWLLNTKSETIANLDMQNAGAAANAGFVTGIGGKLTVTGTLTHSLGDITLNSSGAGGSAWINAYAVINLGGAWTFGANDGTQTLIVGAGGLTMGNGSTLNINASSAATNAVSLGGNVASQASATQNTISGNGEVKLNAARVFDVADGAAASDLTISASMTDGTGTGALTKTGLGTLTLSGTSTYLGTTAVNAGVLSITATNALPGWDTVGRYTVASGATLAVGNAVSNAAIATLLGTGNFAAGASLGFDTSAGNRTYAPIIEDTLSGALAVTKVGANTLTLTATNTYSGAMTVYTGVLSIPYTNALPGWDTNGRYLVYSNATLLVGNAVANASVTTMLATTNFAAGASIGFDTAAGNRTYASAISNSVNGALGVAKFSANTLTLSGNSGYDGVTTVNQGILEVTHSNALGSVLGGTTVEYDGGLTVSNKAILRLSGGIVIRDTVTINGSRSVPSYYNAVDGNTGTNTLLGDVVISTVGGEMRIGANGLGNVLNFSGVITRPGTAAGGTLLLQSGTALINVDQPIDNNGGNLEATSGAGGAVVLKATPNNIGDTMSDWGGYLRLAISDALVTNRNLTIGQATGSTSTDVNGSGGAFDLNGCNQTIRALIGSPANSGTHSTKRKITNTSTVASTLTLGNGNVSGIFNGVIEDGAGTVALVKVGTASQTLTGNGTNTFSGDTTLYSGTLVVSNVLALQKSTLNVSGGALTFAGGLTDFTLGGLSGAQNLGLTNALNAPVALSVGNNNSDTIFSGALSGSGSLKKIGSGKLTLAGVNTYTGATTVEAGTLALGCDGALSTGTQITLNGGTLSAGSFANGLSALSVGASNGTIDVADGSGALAFAGSSGQTWAGTLNITFTGEWNPYALRFGTSPAGLSAAQLSSLRVNGQKTWLMLDAQGYLVRLTGTLIRLM